MIRQTSLMSFKQIFPSIAGRHKEYMVALEEMGQPSTDLEVTRFAGHSDPNYFRPRRYELMKMGFVVEVGKRMCSVSKKKAIVWWINSK